MYKSKKLRNYYVKTEQDAEIIKKKYGLKATKLLSDEKKN